MAAFMAPTVADRPARTADSAVHPAAVHPAAVHPAAVHPAAGAPPRPGAPAAPRTAPAPITATRYRAALSRGAVVVDVRSQEQRAAQGALPGALAVPPELVLTRLDPAAPGHLAAAGRADTQWILVSDDGDLAAMAAHALAVLGVRGAVHVAGGYRELRRRGLLGAAGEARHLRREGGAIAAH